jgi:hypothetical protein
MYIIACVGEEINLFYSILFYYILQLTKHKLATIETATDAFLAELHTCSQFSQ